MLFIIYHGINKLLCIEYNAMNNYGDCMVVVLVILHVIESHELWCTNIGLVFMCFGPMVWIQEQVADSI